MAFSAKQLGVAVFLLGTASFALGVLAEIRKPGSGEAVAGKDVVICKYPKDHTVVLGSMSFVFLIACTLLAYFSLFYSYDAKSLSRSIFFHNSAFTSFFNIALFTTVLAAALTLWPTIQAQYHLSHKIHPLSTTECPTAKTGLIGGAAFMSLNSALMWLIALMLAVNTRDDHFGYHDSANYDSSVPPHVPPVDIPVMDMY